MKHLLTSLLAAVVLSPAAMAADYPSAPPITVNFADWDAASLNEHFVVIDGNNDGKKFDYNATMAGTPSLILNYTTKSDANDWVITKDPIKLVAGKQCTVIVRVATQGTSTANTETFELKAGLSADEAGMTISLIPATTFGTDKLSTPKEYVGTFTPETAGDYYIGLRGMSAKGDGYYLAYHGFSVEQEAGGDDGGNTGSQELVLAENFNDIDAATFADKYVVENNNGDANEFIFTNSTSGSIGKYVVALKYNNVKASDDWVITKTGIELTAGTKYTVNFKLASQGTSSPETFEVKFGTAATSSSMLADAVISDVVKTDYITQPKEFTGTFTPTTSGTYHLGLHAISPANDGFWLAFHEFSITAEAGGGDIGGGDEGDGYPSVPPVDINFFDWDETSFNEHFVVEDLNGNNKFNFTTTAAFGTHQSAIPVLDWNRVSNADDWVITKDPITLTAGNKYVFKIRASSYASDAEDIEFKAGTSATASAMTETILEKTVVSTASFSKYAEFEGTMIPTTTGEYHFGFHGMTAKGQGYALSFFGFSISEEAAADIMPAVPAAPTVIPNATGKNAASITAIVPDQDVDGNAITEVGGMNLYRDDNLIYTWAADACTPGQEVTVNDGTSKGLAFGAHIYTLKALTANGNEGEASEEVKVYVGTPSNPAAPSEAVVAKTDNDGEVTITWVAPTTNVDGYLMATGILKYKVYDISGEAETLLATVSETSYTYQAVAANAGQEAKRYKIVSSTSNGDGEGTETNTLTVGKPYTVPYTDSFANSDKNYVFNTVGGNGKFALYTTEYPSYDGDNGVAAFTGAADGDVAELQSCEIEIPADATDMVLSYYYCGSKNNGNVLDLLVDTGNGFEDSYNTHSLRDGEWHRGELALSRYAGKTVRFAFRATYVNAETVLIDNVKIAQRPDYDVAVTDLSVPASIIVGVDTPVKATISNIGAKNVTNGSVVLYVDDKIADTKELSVYSNATKTIELTANIADGAAGEATLRVVAYVDGETNLSDNRSKDVKVALETPLTPAATDLIGSFSPASLAVNLSWSAPVIDGVTAPVTDDFESYTPWSQSFGKWSTIDVDGQVTTYFSIAGNDYFYGIGGNEAAFFVADDSEFTSVPKANSGTQMLMTAATDGSWSQDWTNDDWLISPRLSGKKQTIQYAVRASAQAYHAAVQVYVSSTGTAIEDFTLVKSFEVTRNKWFEMTQELPYGTRYFAIRSYNTTRAELMLDDVTYEPAAAGDIFDVVGYNVYCNGAKVNDEPIAEPAFTHENAPNGNLKYYVTAVYSNGAESEPTATVDVDASVSGLESIDAADGVNITATEGAIVVTAADGTLVEISAMDGRLVYRGTVNGNQLTVNVATGIYAVRAGQKVVKLVVR